MGNNKRNKTCVDCGNPTFNDRCVSCASKKKIKDNPAVSADRMQKLAEGRKKWIADRRMTYLKAQIGEPRASYTLTATELAKLLYTAFQRGRKEAYHSGYMQAARRLEGRWTEPRSARRRRRRGSTTTTLAAAPMQAIAP